MTTTTQTYLDAIIPHDAVGVLAWVPVFHSSAESGFGLGWALVDLSAINVSFDDVSDSAIRAAINREVRTATGGRMRAAITEYLDGEMIWPALPACLLDDGETGQTWFPDC
jgi:hypothetical protein